MYKHTAHHAEIAVRERTSIGFSVLRMPQRFSRSLGGGRRSQTYDKDAAPLCTSSAEIQRAVEPDQRLTSNDFANLASLAVQSSSLDASFDWLSRYHDREVFIGFGA